MNSDDLSVLLERIDTLSARVRQLERAGMPASTAIPPSPVAQGDLITADATPAWGLLPIGNTREILTVNTAGTEPEWKIVDSARVYRASVQSIPNATWTAINFSNEQHDTGDDNWTIGSPTRLTAQRAGVYLFSFFASFESNVTGTRFARILVNGTTVILRIQWQPTSGALGNGCSIHTMSASSYAEIQVHQTSGSALNVSNANVPWFTATRLT